MSDNKILGSSNPNFVYPQFKDQVASSRQPTTGEESLIVTDGNDPPRPPVQHMIVSALPVQSSYDRSVVVDRADQRADSKPNTTWRNRFIWLAVAALVVIVLTAFVAYTVTDSSNGPSTSSSISTKDSTTISFESTQELYGAVDSYLAGDIEPTLRYGPTIDAWDVSKIQTFDRVFSADRNGACAFFNADLTSWDTSGATSMVSTFSGATQFNGDISTWIVSNVRDTSFMFNFTRNFDGDLSKWDVSKVENMERMFYQAVRFRGDLSKWSTGKVKNLCGMFDGLTEFNSDLSKWDVSSAVDMDGMFYDNRLFDQDISGWNMASVTTTSRMFCKAYTFNQDLSSWNVQNLVNLKFMFEDATSFNQNLCSWGSTLPATTTVEDRFQQTFALTSCPNTTSPILPFGPFCHNCDS